MTRQPFRSRGADFAASLQCFRNYPTVCSLICVAVRYPDQQDRNRK